MIPSLRKLRKMSGITQYALARRCGVGRTRLSLAENGHVRLAPNEYAVVLRVLLRAVRQRAAGLCQLPSITQDVGDENEK